MFWMGKSFPTFFHIQWVLLAASSCLPVTDWALESWERWKKSYWRFPWVLWLVEVRQYDPYKVRPSSESFDSPACVAVCCSHFTCLSITPVVVRADLWREVFVWCYIGNCYPLLLTATWNTGSCFPSLQCGSVLFYIFVYVSCGRESPCRHTGTAGETLDL